MRSYFYNNMMYPDDGFTKIPESAVLIPRDHWFLNSVGIPEGKKIITGEDGLPKLVDIPPEPLKIRLKNECERIDQAAAYAQETLAPFKKTIEYTHVWNETKYFLSALKNDSNAEAPEVVKIQAELTNTSHKAAAKLIKKKHDEYIQALEKIRNIRLRAKNAIRKAAKKDPECDLNIISEPFIQQLQAIK